jgi:polar amino acid transport system substrate-binding protein
MNASHSYNLNALQAVVLFLTVALFCAGATAPTVPPAARSELAPTGKLRVGLLVMNPVYVSKDGPVEEMQGIAVDIARELAKQLGVAFEPVRYKAVNQLLEGAKAGEWDVAFVGLDPTRTADMDFTAAYLEVGNTYLVLADSPIQNIGDADRPGHRIAVTQGATQDLFLSRNLKQAEMVRVPLIQTSGMELLTSGKAHALAGNTQVLVELTPKIPGARVVEGSIFGTPQALAVVKGRPAGAAYAREFIEHVKASGLLEHSIQRANLRGVTVAPPAATK